MNKWISKTFFFDSQRSIWRAHRQVTSNISRHLNRPFESLLEQLAQMFSKINTGPTGTSTEHKYLERGREITNGGSKKEFVQGLHLRELPLEKLAGAVLFQFEEAPQCGLGEPCGVQRIVPHRIEGNVFDEIEEECIARRGGALAGWARGTACVCAAVGLRWRSGRHAWRVSTGTVGVSKCPLGGLPEGAQVAAWRWNRRGQEKRERLRIRATPTWRAPRPPVLACSCAPLARVPALMPVLAVTPLPHTPRTRIGARACSRDPHLCRGRHEARTFHLPVVDRLVRRAVDRRALGRTRRRWARGARGGEDADARGRREGRGALLGASTIGAWGRSGGGRRSHASPGGTSTTSPASSGWSHARRRGFVDAAPAPSERRAYVEDDAEEEPEEAVGEEREDGVERRGEGDMREGERIMNRLSASVAAVEDEEDAAAVDSRRVVLYGVVAARASGGWKSLGKARAWRATASLLR
ncbi:hypothetical protein C8J57DRAFT_1469728 [Mycena rebaudengoi]|nr:hypothetical protein C8J57DRAFT_1469728 [Mycena rebaudengoi]